MTDYVGDVSVWCGEYTRHAPHLHGEHYDEYCLGGAVEHTVRDSHIWEPGVSKWVDGVLQQQCNRTARHEKHYHGIGHSLTCPGLAENIKPTQHKVIKPHSSRITFYCCQCVYDRVGEERFGQFRIDNTCECSCARTAELTRLVLERVEEIYNPDLSDLPPLSKPKKLLDEEFTKSLTYSGLLGLGIVAMSAVDGISLLDRIITICTVLLCCVAGIRMLVNRRRNT